MKIKFKIIQNQINLPEQKKIKIKCKKQLGGNPKTNTLTIPSLTRANFSGSVKRRK